MTKNISLNFLIIIFVGSILSACGSSGTPTPDIQATTIALSVQEAVAALSLTQSYAATQIEASRATATPLPTATPIPSPTFTPGPLIIQDDFSSDTGRWIECGQCRIEGGVLKMGPYPISDKGEGYLAVCSDCGAAQDYKMGVDATFVDGYTDRGFGLLLRESDGDYIDVEITTWQVYGAWIYDHSRNAWGTILTGEPWKLSGALSPSYGTNRVEVDVHSSGGTSTVDIKINGQLVNTGTMPAVSGRVGLVVGLHSLGVIFDNFYFEGYPVTKPVPNNPNPQG